jgi:hypothetical protein
MDRGTSACLQQVRSAFDLFLLRVTIVTLLCLRPLFSLFYIQEDRPSLSFSSSSFPNTHKTWGCLDFEPAFSPLR